MEARVGIFVDYESPLARRVAGDIWSGISRAALDAGYEKTTALWKSLDKPGEMDGPDDPEGISVHILIFGQDRPETVENVGMVVPGGPRLCGIVVAIPDRPSPLSGALLYQGVDRLTNAGVRAGDILPALVPVVPKIESEAYTARLLERLRKI